jgi:hypothetical protein
MENVACCPPEAGGKGNIGIAIRIFKSFVI